MIGFSSDTPSSLGDSAAITWDKRFAKVCKAVSFSAFNALKNIDYLHLVHWVIMLLKMTGLIYSISDNA